MPELPKPRNADRGRGKDSTPEAYANARRWQIIWPRAIAYAWANSDFKTELQEHPRETLKKYFNYELSVELELTIQDAPDGTPGYNPKAKEDEDPWQHLPHMELKLFIPPAPKKLDEQAIALADYSDTGRTYPMTSG